MTIKVWYEGMPVEESKDLAYWERNMLALRFADGWYDDLVNVAADLGQPFVGVGTSKPRYAGWRRVLTLDGGKMTFHIPDEFDVGNLPRVSPNWDGHTTEQKWRRVQERFGI